MDVAVIDQEYQQLQDETSNVTDKIKNLAAKLQAAKGVGNDDAREWILDLKEIALAVQAEQNQMFSFLQTLHSNLPSAQEICSNPSMYNQGMNNNPQMGGAQQGNQQQGGYQQQNQQPQQKKGFFSSLLGSGFGQAIEMGAGFGMGDDLINSIF